MVLVGFLLWWVPALIRAFAGSFVGLSLLDQREVPLCILHLGSLLVSWAGEMDGCWEAPVGKHVPAQRVETKHGPILPDISLVCA